jgi:hypothetical protein
MKDYIVTDFNDKTGEEIEIKLNENEYINSFGEKVVLTFGNSPEDENIKKYIKKEIDYLTDMYKFDDGYNRFDYVGIFKNYHLDLTYLSEKFKDIIFTLKIYSLYDLSEKAYKYHNGIEILLT